jgi:hypothetical protein
MFLNKNVPKDLHTIDLEDFKYGDMNITAYRLVDPEKPEVQEVVRQWNSLSSATNFNTRNNPVYGPYYYGAGDQSRKSQKDRRVQDQYGSAEEENIQMMPVILYFKSVQIVSRLRLPFKMIIICILDRNSIDLRCCPSIQQGFTRT